MNKLSPEEFARLLKELDNSSVNTLISKNKLYSADGDCLHNFRIGGDISGLTPAQTCWGYLTKHLASLRDIVFTNDFTDGDILLEKCQDAINYIRFLYCIGMNEHNVFMKGENDNEN